MKISNILSTKPGGVITIGPDKNLADAIAMLVKHNIGALVVVDEDERLRGILSERDIIRALNERGEALRLPVKAIMTTKVIVGLAEDDVMSVAHTMTERRFRHLPVMEGQELIGIVSIGDILKAQRDQYRGEIDTLETQILARDID
jgi:CBS domain-containing protein